MEIDQLGQVEGNRLYPHMLTFGDLIMFLREFIQEFSPPVAFS